ncbi:hypothetical protein [Leucobacter sp. gxy201]|uniref:hypothetical protein n=1 Tax=Leucobacter sp. gxy201 TaxID=2957200 RepID=UPI003D9FC8E6
MTHAPNSKAAHIAALAAGVLAIVVLFAMPGGPVSYLIAIAAGLIAVIIGHYAARRSGPLWRASILGVVLAYLELIVSVGLFVVRVIRILT